MKRAISAISLAVIGTLFILSAFAYPGGWIQSFYAYVECARVFGGSTCRTSVESVSLHGRNVPLGSGRSGACPLERSVVRGCMGERRRTGSDCALPRRCPSALSRRRLLAGGGRRRSSLAIVVSVREFPSSAAHLVGGADDAVGGARARSCLPCDWSRAIRAMGADGAETADRRLCRLAGGGRFLR